MELSMIQTCIQGECQAGAEPLSNLTLACLAAALAWKQGFLDSSRVTGDGEGEAAPQLPPH